MSQAKRELEELQQQEPQAQAELPDFEPQAPAARRQNLHLAMHISVGLAGLCAWWYYLQDVPALERKLMSVLLSPVSLKHDITCFQLATCCQVLHGNRECDWHDTDCVHESCCSAPVMAGLRLWQSQAFASC